MKRGSIVILILLLIIIFWMIAIMLMVNGKWMIGIIVFIPGILVFSYLNKIINHLFAELNDFTVSVKNKDFSRKYIAKEKIKVLSIHSYINKLNETFSEIYQEKETQQQYLKKILELVDTGIIAYNIDNKDILWMNGALMSMLMIPELKNLNWLEKHNPVLYEQFIEFNPGEKKLVTIHVKNQIIKPIIQISLFQTDKKKFKLIVFHNINNTLEEIESNAWKGLLSVMTHEIMNSVTPVSSLADTLKKQVEFVEKGFDSTYSDTLLDMKLGIDTIKRRSEGLLRFTDVYRNLSKTIIPNPERTNINEMLENIYLLMQPLLNEKNIVLEIKSGHAIPDLFIDKDLIEQTIINFITNAVDALQNKENKLIIISSGVTSDGKVLITIADNGKGIADNMMEKIFIPFFSTKKNGNGIGLSLSRQIIKLHKAQLKIQTKEGEGSAFTIIFSSGTIFKDD